jgi:hypothetical protein
LLDQLHNGHARPQRKRQLQLIGRRIRDRALNRRFLPCRQATLVADTSAARSNSSAPSTAGAGICLFTYTSDRRRLEEHRAGGFSPPVFRNNRCTDFAEQPTTAAASACVAPARTRASSSLRSVADNRLAGPVPSPRSIDHLTKALILLLCMTCCDDHLKPPGEVQPDYTVWSGACPQLKKCTTSSCMRRCKRPEVGP